MRLSVRKGHTLLAGLVASGEVPFALTTYSHGAEKMKQKGAPVEWYASRRCATGCTGVALDIRRGFAGNAVTTFAPAPGVVRSAAR